MVACGTAAGKLIVLALPGGTLVHERSAADTGVMGLAYGPSGRWLVVRSGSGGGKGRQRSPTRGRVRTHHAPRFQALTLFAEYPVQAGVRCGGEAACGAADRFRCAPGLARVCAGGHAVRAAWTPRHGLLMRAGLTVLSANTCGAGHLLTRHLLKRHPIVRRVRLGGAESACSFPRLPTPA